MENETTQFREMLDRIRKGDQAATEELIRRYESQIRREVHLRMTDPRLRRLLESMDICQSVMASFFIRFWAGQYHIEHPGQLLRLLLSMTKHKLVDQARFWSAARRDLHREVSRDAPNGDLLSPAIVERDKVEAADLVEKVRSRLSSEEQTLVGLRQEGYDWREIGERCQLTPDAARMRYNRALARVLRDLNLET